MSSSKHIGGIAKHGKYKNVRAQEVLAESISYAKRDHLASHLDNTSKSDVDTAMFANVILYRVRTQNSWGRYDFEFRWFKILSNQEEREDKDARDTEEERKRWNQEEDNEEDWDEDW